VTANLTVQYRGNDIYLVESNTTLINGIISVSNISPS